MKVLHLLPYSPIPAEFGGAIRVYHMLKNLSRYHDVTIVGFGSRDDAQLLRLHFGPRLKEIHLIPKKWSLQVRRLFQVYSHWTSHSFFHHALQSRRMQQLLDEILDQSKFDIIQTEFAHMGIFHLDHRGAVRILDAHNVEYDNFRRIWLNTKSHVRKYHYYQEYRKFFNEELEVWRRQDAIFATSKRDLDLIDSHVPEIPKFIVPNGVDTSYFIPSGGRPEPNAIVFTGLMSYVPNYDGMLFFLDEIFPRIQKRIRDVKVYIVGNKPPKELLSRRASNIIVTSHVEDVRPYIERASVYVVPLRMGGGTRLKVLEALAMKKPIVTTNIGCEGIDVVDQESVLIANKPEQFADDVVRLLQDRALQRRLAETGHDLVLNRYDWSVIGELQEQYYEKIVRNTRKPQTLVERSQASA